MPFSFVERSCISTFLAKDWLLENKRSKVNGAINTFWMSANRLKLSKNVFYWTKVKKTKVYEDSHCRFFNGISWTLWKSGASFFFIINLDELFMKTSIYSWIQNTEYWKVVFCLSSVGHNGTQFRKVSKMYKREKWSKWK